MCASGARAMSNNYDVAIVGSGIAGLVCGAYLAKHGKKVIIVEKHQKCGGCCSTFEINGFKFDAGTHVFTELDKKGILNYIFKKIGLQHKFYKIIPTDKIHYDNKIMEIPEGVEAFAHSLVKKFPRESVNIKMFFCEIEKIYGKFIKPDTTDLNSTYSFLLDKHFKDRLLKDILSIYFAFIGSYPKESSMVMLGSVLFSIVKGGLYYPAGGAGGVVNSIIKEFIANGGEIRTNAECTSILINATNKTVEKLVINDREKISAKIYVSDSDVTRLFETLIKPNIFHNEGIVKEFEASFSLHCLYIGCELNARFVSHKTGWHLSYKDRKLDPFFISCPSLIDNSLAPNNKSTIICFRIDEDPVIKENTEYKNQQMQKSLKRLTEILPAIKNNIAVIENATPYSIFKYTLNSDGAAYGWKPKPQQMHGNFKYDLPKNLFIVGHWSGFGGGVTPVAISGYKVATDILGKRELFYG